MNRLEQIFQSVFRPKTNIEFHSCGCNGKKIYDVVVFKKGNSKKMKLCKDHIQKKCEQGCFVDLQSHITTNE